jgi:NADPH-dependent curcumin reductase CurA
MENNNLTSREIYSRQHLVGRPTENDFHLVKVDVPELKDGEFLVHNIWMSVDSYMHGRIIRS